MPASHLRIGLAQTDCVLADLSANLDIVEQYVRDAKSQDVDLLLFPELALSGYRVGESFSQCAIGTQSEAIERLKKLSRHVALALGFIEETEDVEFYNSAMFLMGGKVRHVHRKVYLPTYRIFTEKRFYGSGSGIWAFDTPWTRMAILICGDCWHLELPYLAAHDGANVLLVVAASARQGLTASIPTPDAWERLNRTLALSLSSFVAFTNRAGNEQDLDFWGGSHAVLPDGNLLGQARFDEPDLHIVDLDLRMLRNQRMILPFRRDDNLPLTLEIGRRVLREKKRRRNGFFTELHTDWGEEPADLEQPISLEGP